MGEGPSLVDQIKHTPAPAPLPVREFDDLDPEPCLVSRALDVQEGGDHYKDMAIQPVEYMVANGIGFVEGSVIKYVSRWKSKNGVEDLKKARHFLDLLIEAQTDEL